MRTALAASMIGAVLMTPLAASPAVHAVEQSKTAKVASTTVAVYSCGYRGTENGCIYRTSPRRVTLYFGSTPVLKSFTKQVVKNIPIRGWQEQSYVYAKFSKSYSFREEVSIWINGKRVGHYYNFVGNGRPRTAALAVTK